MTLDAEELLEPGHVLYRGAGEWTKEAQNLRAVFYALDEIERMTFGRPGAGAVAEQVRRGQLDTLTHLQAIAAMLEDPSLRWFMKGGGQ